MRIFTGIKLPDEVTEILAALSFGLLEARWIASENLHLTLRFIGDVDADLAADLDGALREIQAPRFELALANIDCFHSRGRVRAVWVGAEIEPPLKHLQEKVESAMVRAGLAPEGRKFTPHITLARLKNVPLDRVRPYLEQHTGLKISPFTVEEFTLFRSHLGRKGATYERLVDYPLRRACDARLGS